ncbi:hypothetical protein [Streptacidiphilus rugosus]|uniref:hypothetical protein n=1 Tax=Streptacidiphilus rugosus TaxID=405783 RepID=UPI00056CE603|nr:hypothetical protein [Streptacidiphilus rugosus]
MILLDTGAIRAFWNSHPVVSRLVDDANRTSGRPLIVPTFCLLEVEQQIPGAGITVTAQPGVMPEPLTTPAALAAAQILHRYRDLTQGMAVAIATATAPVERGEPAHFILTDHPDAYPRGIVAVSIDHLGL